jgi:hypothetical protein
MTSQSSAHLLVPLYVYTLQAPPAPQRQRQANAAGCHGHGPGAWGPTRYGALRGRGHAMTPPRQLLLAVIVGRAFLPAVVHSSFAVDSGWWIIGCCHLCACKPLNS